MSNITVIGASAGVGLSVVVQGIGRGHIVTALSRNLDSIPDNTKLFKVVGSATNASDVRKAIANADAVIVTIGTGNSTKKTTLYTDCALVLMKVQQELNTNIPFIILTGFGAGNSSQYQGFFMKLLFDLMLKSVYENKTLMEEVISESTISWEFVRSGMLNNKGLTKKYRVETSLYKGMNIGSISRDDVADYLLNEAESPKNLKSYVSLSGK